MSLSSSSRRWTGLGIAGVGLVTVAVLGTAAGGSAGEVTLEVAGALNVSAYCGGDDTHYADGERLSFVPEAPICDLEAPLSPQMPLRGRVDLGKAGRYRCERDDMEITCVRTGP